MPTRRRSKKDSPAKLAKRMSRRWRVVLLRAKGEILGTVEAPGVLPVTSLIPREEFISIAPNAITFEKHPVLRKKFVELFSLSSGANNASGRLAELLCCLPKVTVPSGLGYENVFRVAVVQFMDRFNFCLAGVKRSCIHFVTPNGQIIPFDTYNLFYRNDRIAGIRADLASAHRRRRHSPAA